jgi:hypothetical protein
LEYNKRSGDYVIGPASNKFRMDHFTAIKLVLAYLQTGFNTSPISFQSTKEHPALPKDMDGELEAS